MGLLNNFRTRNASVIGAVGTSKVETDIPAATVVTRQPKSRDYDTSKKILGYIKANHNKSYTQVQMAKDLGLTKRSTYMAIHRLRKSGQLNGLEPVQTKHVIAPTVDTPQPTDLNELILDYVNKHQGEMYTLYKMFVDLGINHHTGYSKVSRLMKRKLLDKDFNTNYRPSKFMLQPIVHALEDKTCETCETYDEVEPTKEVQSDMTFEDEIWQFIKTTGSTNVVDYMKYIQAKE